MTSLAAWRLALMLCLSLALPVEAQPVGPTKATLRPGCTETDKSA